MIRLTIFSMGLISCFLFSCDPGVTVNYQAQNKTKTPITIKYQFIFSSTGDTSFKEATIPSGVKATLCSELYLGTIKLYNRRGDTIPFAKFEIDRNGNQSIFNLKSKRYWHLETNRGANATYSIVVGEELFGSVSKK